MKDKRVIEPRQQRAKQTRERILNVSERLIASEGIKKLNTNRVAEEAHISIATLYQYFRNKEAIIDELLERYLDFVACELAARFARIRKKSVRKSVETGIMQVIDLFHETEGLFLQLAINYSDPLSFPGAKKFEENTLQVFTGQFRKFPRESNNKKPASKIAVVLAYQATMSILTKHLTAEAPTFSDRQVAKELAELICSYLKITDSNNQY